MNFQNYSKIIETFTESQLRELVKLYLMEKERTRDVRISDGSWDGGCDLIFYRNSQLVKKTVQTTVQKNDIDNKFKEDLKKAADNVKNNGFLSSFYFFVSHPVSQGKQNDWDSLALAENIELMVFDSKALGEECIGNPEMSRYVKEVYTGEKDKLSFDSYIQSKILYDILALGKDASNIKLGFLKSFSMVYLFDNPGATAVDIKEYVDKMYHEEIPDLQLKRMLHSCCKEDNPTLTASIDGKYFLTEKARSEFENIRNQSDIDEKKAHDELHEIMEKVGVGNHSDKLFAQLEKWFREKSDLEINRMRKGTHAGEETSIEDHINTYLLNIVPNDNIRNSLIEEIAEFLAQHNYFEKIGRTHLFHSLLSKGAIDNYFDVLNKSLFLDTQVLLQLVCVTFANNINYSDFSYRAVEDLWLQKERMDKHLKILSTTDYLDEVANHLAEARRLRVFINNDDFGLLGGSRNVFVNFYMHLRDHESFGYQQFDDFLSDMLGSTSYRKDMSDKEFIQLATRHIFENLEGIGINFKSPINLSNNLVKNELDNYEKILHLKAIDNKTKHSRKTDLNMMILLDSNDVQNRIIGDNIVTDSPFLISWDNSFAKCQEYYSANAKSRYIKGNWYVYSPSTMAERLSVATLELNPEAVNYDIIRHAEVYYNGYSFLDMLVKLVNPEKNARFVRKILELKKNQLSGGLQEEDKNKRDTNKTVIDKVLTYIYRYYSKHLKYNLAHIQILMERDDTYNDFADIIDDACDAFQIDKNVRNPIYNRINTLIRERILEEDAE